MWLPAALCLHLASALRIATVTDGAVDMIRGEGNSSEGSTEREVKQVTGELVSAIMGLMPSLLANQSSEVVEGLQMSIRLTVEKFMLSLGQPGTSNKPPGANTTENNSNKKFDQCLEKPCNRKAVCVSVGEFLNYQFG